MSATHSNNVTRILVRAGQGDAHAASELLPLIYEERRCLAQQRMVNEPSGQTLQPTALVHEAYLRLVGDPNLQWANRAHFFAAAAEAMRRILVDRARRRRAVRHGGDLARVDIEHIALTAEEPKPDHMIALDDALNRLGRLDARKGRIVTLRYFAGLTIAQTALALNLSVATVNREWQFAKAWLYSEMTRDE